MMGTATLVGSVIGRYLSGNSMYSYLEYHIYIDFGYFIGGFIGAGLGSILKWNKNEEKYEILTKSK